MLTTDQLVDSCTSKLCESCDAFPCLEPKTDKIRRTDKLKTKQADLHESLPAQKPKPQRKPFIWEMLIRMETNDPQRPEYTDEMAKTDLRMAETEMWLQRLELEAKIVSDAIRAALAERRPQKKRVTLSDLLENVEIKNLWDELASYPDGRKFTDELTRVIANRGTEVRPQ